MTLQRAMSRARPRSCGPTPAGARQSTGSHRTADRRIDEVPLDPVARKLLDDVELSGRLNAHLLPIADARVNFEAHSDQPRAICRDTLAEARRRGVAVPRLEAAEPYFVGM